LLSISSKGHKSILFNAITTGLSLKSGFKFSNSYIYSSIEFPHVSETSSINKIRDLRWANAVSDYISIVFL